MRKLCNWMLLIAALAPGLALADSDALHTLFPLRAEIASPAGGLSRLELPAEVIGNCRADLADIRVLGGDGREIPYIVESPEPEGSQLTVWFRSSPEIVAAERSRRAVDERVTAYRERFVLELPSVPTDVPAWDLALTVAQSEFVSRIDVTAIGPGGARTAVVTGGSVFRLPAAGAENLRFAIPVRDAKRLEVELQTQDTGFLQPRFFIESSRVLERHRTSTVDLRILEVKELGRSTELVVDRPRGLVPRRLVLATSTDTFRRQLTVWDEGPGADPQPLGASAVLRIAAVAPVEVLEIPLRMPHGDRLRMVIDNRDSPPLEDVQIAALMPRPVLVFSFPTDPPHATLFFGGGRAHRPQYDLTALDPDGRWPVIGDEARHALVVTDPEVAQMAALGPVEQNPTYDPAPALGFAMHPGAPIDARPYSHRRRLDVVPSAEGLARVRLAPADLATMRGDLADLRIVDGAGRQWAYLRQDRARAVVVPLSITDHNRGDRSSTYKLAVPGGGLAIDRVELDVEAPYFDRDFLLRGGIEEGRFLELAGGRMIRRAGDPRPSTISFGSRRVDELELEIEDGDDAPLVIKNAEARSFTPDVYLAAPAGTYQLLFGFPEADAPIYELERIRSTILAVPAAGVSTGELEANPDFSPASRLSRTGSAQRFLLWGVLGVAVIVLVVVTLRAARQEAG